MILEIVPNWRYLWTKAEVEKELTNFAFNGVGWYFDGSGGAMLVSDSSVNESALDENSSPCPNPEPCSLHPRVLNTNNQRYWFHYWAVSPIASFNWVANAPVIEDLRK